MSFTKSSKEGQVISNSIRTLCLLFTALLFLSSCTTFIPGLDRILFSNSSAKVGPLVAADEQNAKAEGQASTATAKEEPEKVRSLKPSTNAASSEQASSSKPQSQVEAKAPSIVTPSESSSAPSTSQPSAPAVTAKSEQADVQFGSVAGRVILLGEKGEALPTDGTMVTLTPKLMTSEVKDRPQEVHIIDMEDKIYKPRYSTIHAGDQVVFVNKDNIRHNVFSSSGGNSFDLGTYGAGLKRAVTLEEPGIVKIYCNIHSEMATFVAVGNQGLSVRVDEKGRYELDDVLPGEYEVSIWNIRGETKRVIEVKSDEALDLVDRIDTTAFRVEPHKNKFGGKYSTNSTLFEDEFY